MLNRSPKLLGNKTGAGKWKRSAALALAAVCGLMGEAAGKPLSGDVVAAFPPKIPDSANPFIVDDPKKLPEPLPPPGDHPKLECVVKNINFDGVGALEMTLQGPDFSWDIEPLTEWYTVPPGAGEAVAFVYSDNPKVRLSFTLYKPHGLLPALDAASLIRYVAGIRQSNPKGFVLITPFPPDGSGGNGGSFHGSNFERVDYYFAPATGKVKDAVEYNDYFIDLYGYYMLEMRLSGPLGWLDKIRPMLEFHLRRSVRRKGLGLPDGAADAAKPADGGSAAGTEAAKSSGG